MISLIWSIFIFQLFGQPTYPNDSIAPVFEQVANDNCNLAISIPQDDCAQGLEFPIPINGLNNNILGSNVELSEARIIISHTWELDLRISLRSPNGTRIPLSTENGTSANVNSYGNINVPNCEAHTAFTMDPCLDLLSLDNPAIEENFIGKFLPEGDFANFDGEDPNGIWFLEVCDKNAAADIGRLEYADLIFTEIHCDAPQNVQVSSVNNSSITVSWDAIPSTILTLIEVVPHGAPPSTGNNSVNGNIFQTNNVSASTALELLENTPYDVYVRTRCPNGLFSKNSCPVFIQTACQTQAVTISNNFDDQTVCLASCGSSCPIQGTWQNVSYDDFDWFVGQGSISNSNSGPSGDVQGGGKYAYIQTNDFNCQFNNTAILESTCIQVSANQNACHMSFYYHSFGNGIGELNLEILPQGSQQWISLWNSNGVNENNWLREYIDLRPYDGQNVKMRFVSQGATNNNGILALDEINFYGAQTNGTPSFVHYRDNDNDGYGNGAESLALCSSVPPNGFVSIPGDCDDSNPNINPLAVEIGCNGIDENCNGMFDDNTVSPPTAFFQEVCSGEEVQVEVFNTNGFETHWFSDQLGLNPIGVGNPLQTDLNAGFQTFYAQNIMRNGPGLRLTEINFDFPFHLEIESIGREQNYTGWKIYVNSISNVNNLDEDPINSFNTTPWPLDFMQGGEVRTRIRDEWINPILWPRNKPGWALLIDQQGDIQDAIFWNWTDAEMASLNLNIEGRVYNLSNIPWLGTSIILNNCSGTISLTGSDETNTALDYQCLNDASIGDSNPDLNYEVVCASNFVPVTINALQSPEVEFVLDNDPCDNASVSSSVDLLVNNGVGPFQYQWSNGSSDQNQNNLSPGDYNVTISGGNGCNTIIENITIGTSSASIGVFTREVQNVSCHGAEDGLVVVEVEGGAPPFQFNWAVGVARDEVFENRDTLRGLAEGQYEVTVTDNNGCVTSTDFAVFQPNKVTINISTNLPSCQSSFDGAINIQTLGGNPPYQYQWSNGRTTSNNQNLSFGSYEVTIIDNNDCILISDPINFSPQIDTIVLQSLNVQQVECAGENSGSIETSFEGGVGELMYFWDNGATTPNQYDLEPGSYSLTVTDENNCEFYLTDVDIFQPLSSAIALTFNSTDASCNGVCDGVVATNITGGEPPYTYAWSTGDDASTVFNLCEGAVGLTITDNVGCQSIFDEEIYISSTPTSLAANNAIDSITCFSSDDGVIDIAMTGGLPPYQYMWGHTDQNTSRLSDLAPGTYTLTVTDNLGCIFFPDTVNLIRPELITLDSTYIQKANAGALNGSIEIFISGGRGDFTITWFDANDIEIGSGNFIENIGIGNYSFIAVDQGGCAFERRNLVVELSTSVETSQHLQTFDIAPNPSSDYIYLDAQFDETLDLNLNFYSSSGRLITETALGLQQKMYHRVDVSNYPPGVYFAVLWEKGTFIGRRSFIVGL